MEIHIIEKITEKYPNMDFMKFYKWRKKTLFASDKLLLRKSINEARIKHQKIIKNQNKY